MYCNIKTKHANRLHIKRAANKHNTTKCRNAASRADNGIFLSAMKGAWIHLLPTRSQVRVPSVYVVDL